MLKTEFFSEFYKEEEILQKEKLLKSRINPPRILEEQYLLALKIKDKTFHEDTPVYRYWHQ